MMQLKHYDHDGRARFVTFSTHRRIPILTDRTINDIVVGAIFHVCNTYHLRLLAYVIMPEHVHLVVVPPLTAKLGPIIGEMKFSSAMRIHELLIARQSLLLERLLTVRNGVSKFCLWQRRCYDHNCRTVSSVWEKVNYCHDNPVKRGLVKSAEDWGWSSYSYYRRSDNALAEIDVARSK
jgi:putative transposase